ncbi:uncharacterized protein LOC131841421 [Achroia grisella]|uniref:uncharacterized protein LOC131841421 n=1 Tax=Achroia grisella TaxID=688607 RepID=UPI0027D330C7|nr:uncharacterized protein LOC131841421 [Achroia grisella]
METCVRGFSFMPDTKAEVKDLQFIEGSELQRAWKATRRERMRQQEQKIWEEFVKEQDVVRNVCKDDPYQFLEQLPEACLKELLNIELQKMRKEQEETEVAVIEPDVLSQDEADSTPIENTNQHVVTFVDDTEKEECDIFDIFEDDNDKESGPEDEVLNDSLDSPSTVREQQNNELPPESQPCSSDKASSKSSENVTNTIESTIYCAKVKEIRIKLTEELLSIIETMKQRSNMNLEPEDLAKMSRRAAEFCSRFNRIHLYQLQRQIQDIKRNNTVSLPFAKHTQFQSQMVRIVSLHQNMLHAFQMLHKSLQQTGCVRAEPGSGLRGVLRLARDLPSPTAAPSPNVAALYHDDVIPTCDKLEDVINEFAERMSECMTNVGNSNASNSKQPRKNLAKQKSRGTWSKFRTKVPEADARLSMYSLDTLRLNLNPKTISSRDNQSSATSKLRGGMTSSDVKPAENHPPSKGRKSPRSRRPLMRDPQSDRSKRKLPKETDIQTMVEAVGACASSHISREVSPNPIRNSTRRSNYNSPKSTRIKEATPRMLSRGQNKLRTQSPKTKNVQNRSISPNQQTLDAILSGIRNDLQNAQDIPQVHMSPVSNIINSKTESNQEYKNHQDKTKRGDSPRPAAVNEEQMDKKTERDRNKTTSMGPARCEVTRIVRQLCGGDTTGSKNEKVSGAKNAKLVCISGGSPRQPSTPQLLRILEETIQKKAPKPLFQKPPPIRDTERFHLTFNIPEETADKIFEYRTKFVQHMLTSPMYANSVVGKPWEVIGRISEQIIDELLLRCANEMEIGDVIQQIYNQEIN